MVLLASSCDPVAPSVPRYPEGTEITIQPPEVALKSPTPSSGYNAFIEIVVKKLPVFGGKVELFGNGACSGAAAGADLPAGLDSLEIPATLETAGVHTFSARVFDGYYEVWSPCSTVNAAYELRPPVPPSSLLLYSPVSPGVNATPTIETRGTFQGHKILLFSDNLCANAAGFSVASGATAFITSSVLPAYGTYEFHAKAQNEGGLVSACSAAKATYVYSGPTVPTGLSLISPASSPAGMGTITVLVSGVGSGLTANLFKDATCSTKIGSATASGSTVSVTGTLSSYGAYTIYANTSLGGVVSACSTASMVYEFSGPVVPSALSLVNPASSPGTSASPTIRVSGVRYGQTTNVFSDASCSSKVGSATASYGTADVVVSLPGFGDYNLYANTSSSTTSSSCSSASISYRFSGPVIPSALAIYNPAISPSTNGRPVVQVSGVIAGLTVNIYTDQACATKVGSVMANAAVANVQANALPFGATTFYANTTLGALSSACSSASASYVLEPLPSPSSLTLISPTSSTSHFSRPTIRVNGVSQDQVVTLYSDASCTGLIGTAISSGGSCDVNVATPLPTGVHTIHAALADGNAGRSLCSSVSLTYTVVERVSYPPFARYDASYFPTSVVIADVNGDSKLDLAASGYQSNYLNLFLGNGNGTFQVASKRNVGDFSNAVAAGDFNGDGGIDLVLTRAFSAFAMLLNGNGDGTFQPPVDYATDLGSTASRPGGVATADFNGDGKLDVVVTSTSTNKVSILFGKSDGTLASPVSYATESGPSSVTCGDLNGDGSPDVLVSNFYANSISVFLNDGTGKLQSASHYDSAGPGYQIATGDLDGDGRLDVVVAAGAYGFTVFRNIGAGLLSASSDVEVAGGFVEGVAIGDVDGDGKLDIVAADKAQSFANIYFGLGNGSFDLPQIVPTDSNPIFAVAKDVDMNGGTDLVFATRYQSGALVSGSLSVLAR